jgi:hypothetical protein
MKSVHPVLQAYQCLTAIRLYPSESYRDCAGRFEASVSKRYAFFPEADAQLADAVQQILRKPLPFELRIAAHQMPDGHLVIRELLLPGNVMIILVLLFGKRDDRGDPSVPLAVVQIAGTDISAEELVVGMQTVDPSAAFFHGFRVFDDIEIKGLDSVKVFDSGSFQDHFGIAPFQKD